MSLLTLYFFCPITTFIDVTSFIFISPFQSHLHRSSSPLIGSLQSSPTWGLSPPRLTSSFHWIRSLVRIKKQKTNKTCVWVPTESSSNSSHWHPRPFNDVALFHFFPHFSPASAFYLSQTDLLNVPWANLLVFGYWLVYPKPNQPSRLMKPLSL